MNTYNMIKDFGDAKAGTMADFDEIVGKGLVASGIATLVEGDPVKAAVNAAVKTFREGVRTAVAEELQVATDGLKTKAQHIVVGADRSEPTGGYKSFGHFAYDIRNAGRGNTTASESLKGYIQKTMNETNDGDGAVLVPVEFSAQLMQIAQEESIVRSNATIVPMGTNSIDIPTIDYDSGTAGGTGSGIVAYRIGEGSLKTPSQPALTKVNLKLTKLCVLVPATDEMLSDSKISVLPLITQLAGQAIGFQEDQDYFTGSGTGEPMGVLNAPATVVVAEETAQANDTILFQNIAKMWSRCHPRSQSKAVWVANNDCFPALCSMRMTDAATGVSYPLWVPGQDAAKTPNGSIFGRPLYLSEKMSTLGDEGDIGLFDFSQYLIGQKGGIDSATSIHLRFDYDETVFRFVLRTDGKPWLTVPLQPVNSVNTLSPFVILGERDT